MDFVITENFLNSLGNLSESQISLFKSLDLFINKKASYIIGNYDILYDSKINFISDITYTNIKYVYNVIKKNYECSFNDQSHTKKFDVIGKGEEFDEPVCRTITIDGSANILSVIGNTNNVVVVNNEYEHGLLVKSIKIKNFNYNIERTITEYYEYYDNGNLYKHIKKEYIKKNGISINCGDKIETIISHYDINGNLYKQMLYHYTDEDKMYYMEISDNKTYFHNHEVYKYYYKNNYLNLGSFCEYEQILTVEFCNNGFVHECITITRNNQQITDSSIKVLEHVANCKTFSIVADNKNSYILYPHSNPKNNIEEPYTFSINSEIEFDDDKLKSICQHRIHLNFNDGLLDTINYVYGFFTNIEFLKIKR